MSHKKIYIIISILLILCMGCTKKSDKVIVQDTLQELSFETLAQEQSEPETAAEIDIGSIEEAKQSLPSKENTDIYVHMCGAVQKPGVYRMENGDRIYQAIEAAGGFSVNAQENYVNQSKPLEDGMKIWIPTCQELTESGMEAMQSEDAGIEQSKETAAGSDSVKVNLNTALESELCTLPGVGASKAKSIIAYREKNGKFKKIEDIMKIEGIKEGSFLKLKDQITVQ